MQISEWRAYVQPVQVATWRMERKARGLDPNHMPGARAQPFPARRSLQSCGGGSKPPAGAWSRCRSIRHPCGWTCSHSVTRHADLVGQRGNVWPGRHTHADCVPLQSWFVGLRPHTKPAATTWPGQSAFVWEVGASRERLRTSALEGCALAHPNPVARRGRPGLHPAGRRPDRPRQRTRHRPRWRVLRFRRRCRAVGAAVGRGRPHRFLGTPTATACAAG